MKTRIKRVVLGFGEGMGSKVIHVVEEVPDEEGE